jgi:DNA invertase Pin-like site-specific DNA recombinase
MDKAVCYIRVSTEEQAKEGVSLDAQESKLRAYCAMTGVEIVKIIREEGVSASKALYTRPGGEELLKLIARGQAKHVVSLKLDRLFRDAEDALHQTKAWDKAGVALHLVDMGGQTLNTASPMGRFFLNVMAGFAELERNLIAERTSMALAHKKAHREAYGPTPFGFDRIGGRIAENPSEQAVIGRIQQQRAAGQTLRAIADGLNADEIPTKTGGKWYASTVKYLLGNELYTPLMEAA